MSRISGDTNLKPALGFLTVVEDPQHGLFGGYLLVNNSGKPLEFHCTAPIKPNRAQEILYGPTLLPYLYGEQIGQTLLATAKARPLAVCTDCQPALAVGEHVDVPVVLVLPPDGVPVENSEKPASSADSDKTWRIDASHSDKQGLVCFQLGRNHLALPVADAVGRERLTERLAPMADSFDLTEPFDRIRDAIEEARRGGQ
jgi:hypothetical protein